MEIEKQKSKRIGKYVYSIKDKPISKSIGTVYKCSKWNGPDSVMTVISPYYGKQIENLEALLYKCDKVLSYDEIIKSKRGTYYLVSRNCLGGTLKGYLMSRGGKLPVIESLRIVHQIASAFMTIDEGNKGLLPHRALTLDNVWNEMDWSGGLDILISQFGLGIISKDYLYMSPEMLKGGRVDKITDVWSAGIILYELIYGKKPWSASSRKEMIEKISNIELDTDSSLISGLLANMLQIDPKQRFDWKSTYKYISYLLLFMRVLK